MKRILIVILVASVFLAACAVVPADRRGPGLGGVVIAPILPSVVVLNADPYYFYGDFHYFFDNNRWYYSRSKRGPWTELPWDHYPRETRYRGKNWKYGRDYDDRGPISVKVFIAPVLPPVVVLEKAPYYSYRDFQYFYNNNRWYYSKSKNGPWTELPRDHYPKETRYKGKNWKHDQDRGDHNRDVHDHGDRENDNRGRGPAKIIIAPVLPPVVVLGKEPYYFYRDFQYFYNNNHWYYSKSKNGPWTELPRDHYPKETRYKGKNWKHDRDRDDHDHDRQDQDRDDRRYDNQRR